MKNSAYVTKKYFVKLTVYLVISLVRRYFHEIAKIFCMIDEISVNSSRRFFFFHLGKRYFDGIFLHQLNLMI